MIVTFGDWRIAPYQGGGCRCWQVQHGKSLRALRYYDNLGDALLFCAEYDLRNKVEGTRATCLACFLECDGRGESANEAIKHITATGCDIASREHSMRQQGRPVA